MRKRSDSFLTHLTQKDRCSGLKREDYVRLREVIAVFFVLWVVLNGSSSFVQSIRRVGSHVEITEDAVCGGFVVNVRLELARGEDSVASLSSIKDLS